MAQRITRRFGTAALLALTTLFSLSSCSTTGELQVHPVAPSSAVATPAESAPAPTLTPVTQWDTGARLRSITHVLEAHKTTPFTAETFARASKNGWLVTTTSEGGLICEQATSDDKGIAATIILYDGSGSEQFPLGLKHSETGVQIKVLGKKFTATQWDTTVLSQTDTKHRELVNSSIVAAYNCILPLEQALVREQAKTLPPLW